MLVSTQNSKKVLLKSHMKYQADCVSKLKKSVAWYFSRLKGPSIAQLWQPAPMNQNDGFSREWQDDTMTAYESKCFAINNKHRSYQLDPESIWITSVPYFLIEKNTIHFQMQCFLEFGRQEFFLKKETCHQNIHHITRTLKLSNFCLYLICLLRKTQNTCLEPAINGFGRWTFSKKENMSSHNRNLCLYHVSSLCHPLQSLLGNPQISLHF